MKKILTIILALLIHSQTNSFAGANGEELKKSNGTTETECFEKLSRASFAFNIALDKVIFEPIAKGYRILPSPIRKGTGNVINNLSLLGTIPNNLLQADIASAGINSGRLIINSTIGILGIFDPATTLGLSETEKEDYGQTFGKWGIGGGCYFVLPVLGPTTVRDLTGTLVNVMGGDPWHNITVRNNTQYFDDKDYYISRGTDAINFRSKNIESFDSLERNSVDFYASIKSLYLQDRYKKINNSDGSDLADDNWEEIEPELKQ
jgi:phospholipid-binding lipoprotein MlaA